MADIAPSPVSIAAADSPPLPRRRRVGRARNWPLRLGGSIVLLVLILALVGPSLATRDPLETNMVTRVGEEWISPPFPPFKVPGFPLGSDEIGRDVWSQLLWAVRPTMMVVALAATIRLLVGTLIGALSGWSSRWWGRLLDALISGALSIPALIVALALIAALGIERGTTPFIVGLSLTGWAETARVVREQTRTIKGQSFIEAARALGGSDRHILWRHIRRQLAPLLWVLFALEVSGSLVLVAALGFLGYYLGGESWLAISDSVAQRHTGTPELGQMLSGTTDTLFQGPWRAFGAGSMVFLIILGFNLLAEGLRMRLSPEQQAHRDLLARVMERASGWWSERVVEPLYDRYGVRRARAGMLGLLVLTLATGFIWSRGSVPIMEGLPVPGGHLWASERRDPYGTLWSPVTGPRTPELLWEFNDPSGFSGGPAVAADGTIYVAAKGGRLYALDPSGHLLWEQPLAAAPVGSPALGGGGEIYVADEEGGLTALSPDGKLQWRTLPPEPRPAASGPIVAPDGTIYYALGGEVQAVDPEGAPLWRQMLLTMPPNRPPHVSPDGSLLFLGERAVQARDGSAPPSGFPTGVDEYAVGADGNLYVRAHETSLIEWEFTEEGVRVVREIWWEDRARFVSPPREFNVTPNHLFWFAFYFDSHESARIAWAAPDGHSLGLLGFPHYPTRPIGIDRENILFTCGSTPIGRECLAIQPGGHEPLWGFQLPTTADVNGGALVPGRLYVTTQAGTLLAIGDKP